MLTRTNAARELNMCIFSRPGAVHTWSIFVYPAAPCRGSQWSRDCRALNVTAMSLAIDRRFVAPGQEAVLEPNATMQSEYRVRSRLHGDNRPDCKCTEGEERNSLSLLADAVIPLAGAVRRGIPAIQADGRVQRHCTGRNVLVQVRTASCFRRQSWEPKLTFRPADEHYICLSRLYSYRSAAYLPPNHHHAA